ncbi:hypothetical protein E8E13_002551 [Curvularia kusanoi]|uniref:Uncharacterized protein n=1 Tax=Curvularia kusanoi TaxID=90978 RepID=A0A9P4T638_CURKU|nr:hypothetical protein E8E13_002551 [Curvularia kusanoi]
MAPKKDGIEPAITITGYDSKETRLLAAAFVSSIGHDKYDYALMSKLTGFTESTSKKFWPVVKKKVMEEHPELAKHLASNPATAAVITKNTSKKRKRAADEAQADADAELDPTANDDEASEKPKKAPAKVTGKKRKLAADEAQADADADMELDPKVPSTDDNEITDAKPKKSLAKGKRGKKVKVEEEAPVENSADGGDEMGKFVYRKDVVDWLGGTDELPEEV